MSPILLLLFGLGRTMRRTSLYLKHAWLVGVPLPVFTAALPLALTAALRRLGWFNVLWLGEMLFLP